MPQEEYTFLSFSERIKVCVTSILLVTFYNRLGMLGTWNYFKKTKGGGGKCILVESDWFAALSPTCTWPRFPPAWTSDSGRS